MWSVGGVGEAEGGLDDTKLERWEEVREGLAKEGGRYRHSFVTCVDKYAQMSRESRTAGCSRR